MDRSTPGLPVHHQLPEFTQTHVPWVSDAIQPSHPLSSPSPPALYFSQHQGLFKWVSSSHQVAKVLEFQLQHQSFQWTLRTEWIQKQDLYICCLQETPPQNKGHIQTESEGQKQSHKYREQTTGCQWRDWRRKGQDRGRGLKDTNYYVYDR